jgi:[ribosomal protein S18]-alanine N-acetyltransferase
MSRAPSIQLRPYHPRDFESLYEIDQACYEPAIAYSRRELRNYLRFPGADCIVAQSGKKIVGFVVTAHEDRWGYIVTIDVLESYRRHGVGTMLLDATEEKLRSTGVRVIGLETATDNSSAIAFWVKHGYRKRSVRKDYYPGGRDAFSMTKSLEGNQ